MKKVLAIILLISVMTAFGTIAPPSRTARADLFGVDVTWEIFWDFLWESLKANLRQRLLDMMVDDIIAYIQGNGEAPRFIEDFGGYLGDAANAAAGDVALSIGAGVLCSPFGAQVQLSIIPVPKFTDRVQCTLTGIVDNIQNFYLDFSTGGWDGYMAHWLPQNNYYGATYIAQTEQEARALAAVQRASTEATANRGFLSGTVCEVADVCTEYDDTGNCSARTQQNVSSSWQPANPLEDYCVKTRIVTPGNVIGGLASQAAGADISRLIGLDSNQLQEYLSAITNAFINRIADEAISGAQKGLLEARSSSGDGQTQGQRSSQDQVRNRLGGLADVFEKTGQAVGRLAGTILNLVGQIFDTVGNPCLRFSGLGKACLWNINEPGEIRVQRQVAVQNLAISQCTSDLTAENFDSCAQRMIDLLGEAHTNYQNSNALFVDLRNALSVFADLASDDDLPDSSACTAIVGARESVERDDFIETKNREASVLAEYQALFEFGADINRIAQKIQDIDNFRAATAGNLPLSSAGVTLNSIISDIEETKILAEKAANRVDIISSRLITAAVRIQALSDFAVFPNKVSIVPALANVRGEIQSILDGPDLSGEELITKLNGILDDLLILLGDIEALEERATTTTLGETIVEEVFNQLSALLTPLDVFIGQREGIVARIDSILSSYQTAAGDPEISPDIVEIVNDNIGILQAIRATVNAIASPDAFIDQRAGIVAQIDSVIENAQLLGNIVQSISALQSLRGIVLRTITFATTLPPIFTERNNSKRQYDILNGILREKLDQVQAELLACDTTIR